MNAEIADHIREPERSTPIIRHSDVVVCGGGPAGVAAALASARAGADTFLLEAHGCLGGVWTVGLLSWVLDSAEKPGIMAEIIEGLDRRGARRDQMVTRRDGVPRVEFSYDPEAMKVLLEEMCLDAGVQVRLHTRVVAAARDTENRLAVAVTESKSGREGWSGKTFVDASGDGDLAALAGCGFDVGHPHTGEVQPMSLVALVSGIKAQDIDGLFGPGRAPKQRLLEVMVQAGVEPSYAAPSLFQVRDDLFAFVANHEYGVSATDADQITQATLSARAEVHRLVVALRRLGGAWQSIQVVATGSQIGVREGRRVHGLYTVTEEDVREGRSHEDAICSVAYGIDVHSTNPATGRSFDTVNATKTRPYDIPLRALIARDVEGLLLAGRCISGDFIAHSSYRVTGNAVALGQAAGALAAAAAGTGRLPQAVPVDEVRSIVARVT